ncbi:uncharacterized protein K452DRAFT_322066 [Aplosporella prunicola CBS 121167]|uniref:Uncharacterized protein n=1 Tax=Aplosporella prunicola CBS 121167 TaxID=1176127 RepID=A0A6A6AZ19_9PEZI|nr:uncharacterized protein K452DRAFT_322066 [Aplosporella prunicola CBS 121167]KAF2137030.1 hypothetical protein K452DRAFT_322066 [Aplosporella prunicola CBS 121167]
MAQLRYMRKARSQFWRNNRTRTILAELDPTSESIEYCGHPVVSADSDLNTLCSWNTSKDGKSTYVPGSPPIWTPRSKPYKLRKPSAETNRRRRVDMVGVNSAFFHALGVERPSFNLTDTDIIAKSSILIKLFLCAAGVELEKSLNIDLSLVGNTLLLNTYIHPQKINDFYHYPGADLKTWYGMAFEDEWTTRMPELKDTNHMRAVQYTLGDLNCIVQSQQDAYLEMPREKPSGGTISKLIGRAPTLIEKEGEENELKVNTARLYAYGHKYDASKLAEIKMNMNKEYIFQHEARLWLSRIPNCIFGSPGTDPGVISNTYIRNAKQHYPEWEEKHHRPLRQFTGLLRTTLDIMKRAPSGNGKMWYNISKRKLIIETYGPNETPMSIVSTKFRDQFWPGLPRPEPEDMRSTLQLGTGSEYTSVLFSGSPVKQNAPLSGTIVSSKAPTPPKSVSENIKRSIGLFIARSLSVATVFTIVEGAGVPDVT